MYEKGDIVQITDKDHHWYPCLVIISEPNSWGVLGYISFPVDNKGDVREGYIRLENKAIQKCGQAIIVTE